VDEQQSVSQNARSTSSMEDYVAEFAAGFPFGAGWLIVNSM
jgi:hypothetical protein